MLTSKQLQDALFAAKGVAPSLRGLSTLTQDERVELKLWADRYKEAVAVRRSHRTAEDKCAMRQHPLLTRLREPAASCFNEHFDV